MSSERSANYGAAKIANDADAALIFNELARNLRRINQSDVDRRIVGYLPVV